MALEKCPFCEQIIDTEAVKCFFCGSVLNREAVEERLEQLEIEDEKASVKKIHCPLIVILLSLSILTAIIVFPHLPGQKSSQNEIIIPGRTNIRLNAELLMSGTKFTITNKDSFDWNKVELYIIQENTSQYFTFVAPTIPAGQSYTVEKTAFTGSNGVLFDPSTMKIHKLQILCKTPTGKTGSYTAVLK
jgi:hypothetical protein